MSRPLDAAFAAEAGVAESKPRRFKGIALVGFLIAGLAGTGTVFAASVGINGGNTISYTQGTQVIAACDPDGIGVQLEYGFSTSDNVWLINHYRQGLTGVHSDCFSVASGVKRTLKVSFYEGSTLQVSILGSMPLKSYNGFSVDTATNNNTLYFAGFGNTSHDTTGMSLGTTKSCSPSNPSTASWVCGSSFSTSPVSTTGTAPTITWANGCAAIANQPTATPSDQCRPWHVAANSDRIVIEIE
ncbi:MAG: hypothetical protein RL418_142 [Actinomycetota bacterium]